MALERLQSLTDLIIDGEGRLQLTAEEAVGDLERLTDLTQLLLKSRKLVVTVDGVTGPAGTITSVKVTGRPAGSQPTITLGGTPEARTMAFGIPAGANGTNGTNATITGATATALAAGAAPTVTLGGTASARTFAFGIPAANWNPATVAGYNAAATQSLKNVNGTLTWVTDPA